MERYVDITIRVPEAELEDWLEEVEEWTINGHVFNSKGEQLHAELYKVRNVPTFNVDGIRDALHAVKDVFDAGSSFVNVIKEL